jgi:DsbE subfamily thiol:disulfide oxidoreductase
MSELVGSNGRSLTSRRDVIRGGASVAALGIGAALGARVWEQKDLSARFFNKTTIENFSLPPLPGLATADGAGLAGFSAADLSGKRSLLNLWASFCPSCRVEHPLLTALARQGIAIYGADVKDQPDHARAFLAEHGNPFAAVGLDERAFLQRALGARGVPASFVIGPGPTIELAILGPLDEETIATRILPALARPLSLPARG